MQKWTSDVGVCSRDCWAYRISQFFGISKNSPEIEPKVARYRVDPAKIHAASLWISGLCHSANFQSKGPGVCRQEAHSLAILLSSGYDARSARQNSNHGGPRVCLHVSKNSPPFFFPLLPCSRALSLHFDCKLEQAYSAAVPRAHYPSLSTSLWHVRRIMLYRSPNTTSCSFPFG